MKTQFNRARDQERRLRSFCPYAQDLDIEDINLDDLIGYRALTISRPSATRTKSYAASISSICRPPIGSSARMRKFRSRDVADVIGLVASARRTDVCWCARDHGVGNKVRWAPMLSPS